MEIPTSSTSEKNLEDSTELHDSDQKPSNVHIQDFTTDLHCSLCNGWFHEPLMLRCGHNFCQTCIQNFWKQKTRETCCPECNMLCSYSNCTFNLVLEKLVEKMKKLSLLKSHPQCPEHGESLKLFSKPDGKLICFQCKDVRLSVGQSKDFLQLSDAVQYFTEKLTIIQSQLKAHLEELQSLRDMQSDAIEAYKENKMELQKHITLEFLKLHQFLHSREKVLLSKLQEEGKALNEEMELNLNQLQEQCVLATEMMASIQTRIEQQNSFDFLKDITSLLDRSISTNSGS